MMVYRHKFIFQNNLDIYKIYEVINNAVKYDSGWYINLSGKQFKNCVGIYLRNDDAVINVRIFPKEIRMISSKDFECQDILEILKRQLPINEKIEN
ncbi:hypothetical protein mvi_200 [Megavirus vitis]|uniref:Uncharacterized protein n=1 Tax=Megavirus courdo7 TaxID=1128135 RepID=H2EA77_9VIRU|nr:hypothetical protein c7_L234 [Megavirus courdo7]AVL93560.1 hypothetical protein mvi_200 [Megavirus vitis]